MSVESNKSVVRELLKAIALQELDRMVDLMTDDGIWIVPGNLPISGSYPAQDMKRLLEQMAEKFGTAVELRITGMIGESDKVAAECESSIDTKDGKRYRNKYHFLFEFEGGKVSKMIEYCDTKHVWDVFLA